MNLPILTSLWARLKPKPRPPESQALNFLWLNLDIPAPPDPEDGSIREPMPERYIENVRKAGAAHPSADIFLWVDSKRLTDKQMAYLRDSIEEDRPNVRLKDLRGLPAYNDEPLYNEAAPNENWRDGGKTSMIWRQVDAAKILISLQGNYTQSFFADLDHAHLDIGSPEVQGMIQKHGLMVGASSASEKELGIENQLWGFDGRRRGFFASYYLDALKKAHTGHNAWNALRDKIGKDLFTKEDIKREDIILPIDNDGTQAEHTGHAWRSGYGRSEDPSLISAQKISETFEKRARTGDTAKAPVSVSAPRTEHKPRRGQ